ncbi:MAG: amidase [Solirubrobacteraceae bacterium]|jgi:amidase|nr:amidase [Solirubrobacteraceae bacterium]
MIDPTRTPVTELADALRDKELSAAELLDACLAEVDRLNDELNAVVYRDDDAVRATARDADERLAAGDDAPFLGVPMPIKDLTEVHGWPLSYGSRGRGDEPWEGPSELCVDAFQRAGFVLACKTNTPEFGHITATENLRFGPSRNPWDLERTPGGSSGGAAAATAGGMFPAAHANDGGGSIRIPASCCGLVGLKPSRGRVPRLNQSWLGAIVEGAVTRTVADAAAILDVLSTPDTLSWYNAPPAARPFREEVGADAGRLRIALMDSGPNGMPTDPACTEAAQRTARALAELGHAVEPIELPTISQELVEPFNLLVAASLGEHLDEMDWEQVEPHIAYQHAAANEVSSFEYVFAMKQLERMSRQMLEPWGREFDVLLTPTMAITPPAAGAVLDVTHANPEAPAEAVIAMVAFTAFANVTGQPAISLPVHWTDDGIPVGAQLVGRPWDEATILQLAGAVEQALPWADRAPALAAG